MCFALAKLNIVFFPADRTERDPDRSRPVFIPKHEILESLRFEIRAVAAQERLALIAPVGFHFSVFRAFIHNSKEANKGVMATGTSRSAWLVIRSPARLYPAGPHWRYLKTSYHLHKFRFCKHQLGLFGGSSISILPAICAK